MGKSPTALSHFPAQKKTGPVAFPSSPVHYQPFPFFFAETQPKRRRFGWASAKKNSQASSRETRPAELPLQAVPLARPSLSPPFWPAGQPLHSL